MQAPPDQRMTNTAKKMRHHKETQAKTTNNGTTKKTTQRRAQTKDGQTLGTIANGEKTHGKTGKPKRSETPGLKNQTNGTTPKDTNINGPPSTRQDRGCQQDLVTTKKEKAKAKAKRAKHTEKTHPNQMKQRKERCTSPTSQSRHHTNS